MDVFLHTFPLPGVARLAAEAEAEGWDGILLADSQNLQAEVFVELALAARATDRLRLGTGVTNPLTRHPAVTASAAATLQAESGGRIVLGVGRGDSAVTFIGESPAPVGALEDFLRRLQAYLRGDVVELAGFASRLEWLPGDHPKVPVDVAGAGQRTIQAGAREADAVTFAVGADADRIRWAVETARDAGATRFGAYVVAAAHPDIAVARGLVRANVAIFARFSRGALARLRDDDRRVVEEVSRSFETGEHPHLAAGQPALVTDEFVDRYAVAGPPERCVERLRELGELGVERVVVVGASKDAHPREAVAARKRFATEVLPALRDV
ncbi:MAG: LLM class flavin-dependent oxidoreductase [Actinomycetota bacterium]|nr:LLM class flavin-dependent oxidoreductase [Actinomycetota bacterium]